MRGSGECTKWYDHDGIICFLFVFTFMWKEHTLLVTGLNVRLSLPARDNSQGNLFRGLTLVETGQRQHWRER